MSNENFVNNVMDGIFQNTMVNIKQANELAWNGITGAKSFKEPVTVEQAAEACGANYEVKKYHLLKISDDLYKSIKDGEPITDSTFGPSDLVKSHMSTVREDNGHILGIVGKNYGVVQNATSMQFFNHLINGDVSNVQKPVIETAGILGGGGRFFITAKMPSTMSLSGDNSIIDDYILLTNSHDGSGSVTVLFTPIRVVCRNTLNAALRYAKNKLIFKHTSKVNERMDLSREANIKRAAEVLHLHDEYIKNFFEEMEYMRTKKFDEKQVKDMICKIFADGKEIDIIRSYNYQIESIDTEFISTRKKNIISSVFDSVESGIGQDTNRGTGLWLYNGITTWANNGRNYRDAEYKMNSLIEGDVANKVQKMHDLILEY